MAKPNSRFVGTADRPLGHLGFEATLWATADKLRGNLDATEYKYVVLGPVCRWFLEENQAVESENDARLFGGETELSLVA